ncbi:MAG: DUF6671 family protein [Cytophagaceae bacterium]
MFRNRDLLIATMHQKETVIAPILEKEIGVICSISSQLNTDLLGTFSGEVERVDTPTEAAKKKCMLAMELSGCDLAIASEGSFGPHPYIPFLSCDEEILFFYDRKNNLEIVAREISLETNFAKEEIKTLEDLQAFTKRVLFPSHGLIVKDVHQNIICKGVKDEQKLKALFTEVTTRGSSLWLETDMRALYNPTRMTVIEKTTHKLVEMLKSTCPKCSYPGFTVDQVVSGLPCKSCQRPTRSALKYIYRCKKCSYDQEEIFPNHKSEEDPMYCDFCNP